MRSLITVALFFLTVTSGTFAQGGPALGFDPASSFQSSNVDNVNVANGNVVFKIPLFSLPQRGAFKPITFYLGGDTAGWTIAQQCGDSYRCYYRVQNANPGGFGIQVMSDIPSYLADGGLIPYDDGYTYGKWYSSFSIQDEIGTTHPLVYKSGDATTLRSVDGSGLLVTYPAGYTPYDPWYKQKHYGANGPYPASPIPKVTDRSGVSTVQIATPDTYYGSGSGYYWYSGVQDLDGNSMSFPDPHQNFGLDQPTIDTLGRRIYAAVSSNYNTSNPAGNCPNVGVSGQPATAWTIRNFVDGYGQSSPDPRYSYKICFTQINYHTNSFGGTDGYQTFSYDPQEPDGFYAWAEAKGTAAVIQSVVLPDGSYWGFVYDSVPDPVANPNAIAMGTLTKIITPEGGAISYCHNPNNQFSMGNGLQGFPLTVNFPAVTRRLEQTSSGSNLDACSAGSGFYSYAINPVIPPLIPSGTSTVIDPEGNQTTRAFSLLGEVSADYYEGNGGSAVKLKHTAKEYYSANLPQPSGYSNYSTPVAFLKSNTTSLRHVSQSGASDLVVGSESYSYDEAFTGVAWDCGQYPFPPYGGCESSAPVALRIGFQLSETTRDSAGGTLSFVSNSYAAEPANPGNAYWNANLIDLKSMVISGDSSQSMMQYLSYDDSALSSGGIRGHLTSFSLGGAYTTQTYWKPSLGLIDHVVKKRNSPANDTTVATYSYDAPTTTSPAITYPSDSGPITIGNTTYSAALQPTSIATPIGTESYSYDVLSGLALSHTDVNSQTTNLTYDGMNRVWTIQYPDAAASGSQSEVACYSSPTAVSIYQAQNNVLARPGSSSSCPTAADAIVTTVSVDGLGRRSAVIQNTNSGAIRTDTTYDSLGRVHSVSNPYIGTPTGYATTTTYDGLSRIRTITAQDGAVEALVYDALTTQITDARGNIKKIATDYIGRTTDVYEPTTPNTDPTLHTAYTNGPFGVTGVNQYGQRSRSFSYDSLGHLISASNPESGTTGYGYVTDGIICSTDPSLPCSKTDARNVTTRYSYDSLNRLNSKSYPGSTSAQTTCYQYGAAGTSVPGGLGRLVDEWTQSGTTCNPAGTKNTERAITAYDKLGRVTEEKQCVLSLCSTTPFTARYTYDLAGHMDGYTNGLIGRAGAIAFANTYDTGGRLSAVTSSWSDSTHPALLWSARGYQAEGLTGAYLGNHLSLEKTYDPRLRNDSVTVMKR